MSDYIDRESAIKAMLTRYWDGKETLREIMNSVPAADVAPVKRAHWKEFNSCAAECSKCGGTVSNERLWKKRYCPYCGARMDA